MSLLSLDCMYWYVWIAAIHKRQTSSFFSSSWLQATGSKNVAPTKTIAFPVLYSEASHSIYFFLPSFTASLSLVYVSHAAAWDYLVWPQGWTVTWKPHGFRASAQKTSAASRDRSPGALHRIEYKLTGRCRCPHGSHQHVTAGLGCFHICDCHCSAPASADPTATNRTVLQSSCREWAMQGWLEMKFAGKGGGRRERREGAHVLNLPLKSNFIFMRQRRCLSLQIFMYAWFR